MPGSNNYSMDPNLGEVSAPSLVTKPTSPFYQKKEFQRNTFDKDSKLAEMYGTQASRRDKRRFNRYWKSDQRIADEAAFNKAETERWLAHEKAENDAYIAAVNSFIEKASKPELVTKPQATTPSISVVPSTPTPTAPVAPIIPAVPVAKPAVKPVGIDWNARAKEYGFDSMDAVRQWQSENGLVADGKFGQNSLTKFNELEAQRKNREIAEQEPLTLNREGDNLGTPNPAQPTTPTFGSWAQNNKLDLIYKNGKQYARFDPAGIGDFYVDESGKIFRAGAFGTLGREVSTLPQGAMAGPEGRQYEVLKKMVAGLATHKQGGTMNRIKYFQQGGATQQKDIKAQVTALVQAVMQGDQKATQQVNQIMEAAKAGNQQAMQLAQMITEVAKQLQGQATTAKWGAKLNYIQSLKFAKGGKTCPTCEKKVEMKACGGKKAKKRYFGGLV